MAIPAMGLGRKHPLQSHATWKSGRIPEFICSSDKAAAITPHEFYSVLLLYVLGK